MRDHLAHRLAAELAAELEDARPPDDVARFGARSVREAALAYGILRLSSVHHAEARAAADRLRASVFGEVSSAGGPYRERGDVPAPGLGAQISAAAHGFAAQAEARRRQAAPGWLYDPPFHLVLLGCLTAGAAALSYDVTRPQISVGDAELRSSHPPAGARAIVKCDHIEDPGLRQHAPTGWLRVTFCQLGAHVLPVASDEDAPILGDTLEGTLKSMTTDGKDAEPWMVAVHADVELDSRSYEVYLRRKSEDTVELARHAEWMVTAAADLGALLGGSLWIAAFVRRRRAAAGAAAG
jgi:hypothetical protein